MSDLKTNLEQIKSNTTECLNLSYNILYGYTPLEYIESTGTQYIDTGIVPNENTIVEVELMKDSGSEILWERILGVDNQFMIYIDAKKGTSDKRFKWFANINSGEKTIHVVEYDTKIKLKVGQGNIYYNDNLATTYTTQPNTTTPIYLFWCKDADRYGVYKLYSCKIYNDTELVRDFTPCLDKNNTACLYDKVNKQFYYNLGSGQFNYNN